MKIKLRQENVFFTSDLHLGHANILKYDRRPFGSIQEHDRAIINNWNNAIKPDDVVFHLGDLCFSNGEEYVSQLNGNIYFLQGNHDKRQIKGVRFIDYIELNVFDQHICMFHYPVAEWNRGHHGSWMLYGHTHGNSWFDRDFQGKSKCLNVGTNLHNYTPISYRDIKQKLDKLPAIDHH